MAELPKSPLPQEPEYWEELARKVSEDAADPLAQYAESADAWYRVLARRAHWLMIASAAAMLMLWLGLPVSESSAAWRWMEQSLGPNEIAGILIGGPEPPSVDALMVQFPPPLGDLARP